MSLSDQYPPMYAIQKKVPCNLIPPLPLFQTLSPNTVPWLTPGSAPVPGTCLLQRPTSTLSFAWRAEYTYLPLWWGLSWPLLLTLQFHSTHQPRTPHPIYLALYFFCSMHDHLLYDIIYQFIIFIGWVFPLVWKRHGTEQGFYFLLHRLTDTSQTPRLDSHKW